MIYSEGDMRYAVRACLDVLATDLTFHEQVAAASYVRRHMDPENLSRLMIRAAEKAREEKPE